MLSPPHNLHHEADAFFFNASFSATFNIFAHKTGTFLALRAQIVVAREGDVRMSAWPGELKRSGEWVSVSWSGASASWGDWVGVYSPADADVTVTAPIKYKYADEVLGPRI